MSKRASFGLIGLACFALGWLAAQQLPFAMAQNLKAPVWQHGLVLGVRKADEKEFGKDTKKWGVEVFRDENNGNLVYVSETGSIAVVPGK